jgi:hypothetical protein
MPTPQAPKSIPITTDRRDIRIAIYTVLFARLLFTRIKPEYGLGFTLRPEIPVHPA